MSTIATTNIKHPSSATNNITLASTGAVAINGAMTGAGLDLITPTSIAYSGGSASVSGAAVTFNGVTGLSLNGVFSSTYDNYRVVMHTTLASSGADAFVRLRAAGSDNSTANSYVRQRLTAAATVVAGDRTTADTWGMWQANSTRMNGITFEFFQPFITSTTTMQSFVASSDASAYLAFYIGTHNQNASYDGFTIYQLISTTTGTIRVYGYKNS